MSDNYTKIDIIKELSKKTGFSNQFSKKLIEDFIIVAIENIKKNKFNLKNIGNFKLIDKKERIGRNPKTKEEFNISSRNVITFKASKLLLKYINKNNND